MVMWRPSLLVIAVAAACAGAASPQQVGGIRGVVYDRDFDVPLALARVEILETKQVVTASEEGNFVLTDVPPGTYTLIFTKDGYARQLRSDVVVGEGSMAEIDASLSGEFTDMDEFVVQEVQLGGSEGALLKLRLDSPQFLDSIGAEFLSRSAKGDAAEALTLVAGATVQDGKYAVIRGLPDRYVNSQINGVRLPTADAEKRAVELDQFPAAIIQSVQVSKTFMPDQQGDASGGAVNVILKEIPDEISIQLRGQVTYNSQASGRDDFLTYNGGGVNFWGFDDGSRDIQYDNLGKNWTGAVGVSEGSAPVQYKWSLSGGGSWEVDEGVKIGGFGSFFYEQDASFFDDGVDNSYWVTTPGQGLVPATSQGTPSQGDFKTKLLDVTQSSTQVQWGALGAFGIETENHNIGVTYLYTHDAEDTVTLAEDTRGKAYFFPGYDPNNPMGPGNAPDQLAAAPYLRLETLDYVERTSTLLQLRGEHTLPVDDLEVTEGFGFKAPVFDWSVAGATASFDQPDKRQFGSVLWPESFSPGFPPFIPPAVLPAVQFPYKPDANFNLGNLQRIWRDIEEDSTQFALNLTLPFEQWTDSEGYFKFGYFNDRVERTFEQETFSNFGDNSSYEAPISSFWSAVFPFQDHPITAGPPFIDVDYNGEQKIDAFYAMMDLPLNEQISIIGGARVQSTDLSIENFAEADATWFPPGATTGVKLNPGDADVTSSSDRVLPAIALVYRPIEELTLRGSYSQTIALQTFRELTPILQQEFLGGPIFIGNPDLQQSFLNNYDIRADYTPFAGGLFSITGFYKEIDDPIEYVQKVADFTYTTPVNFPEGSMLGLELEARQDLGQIWEEATGLTVGGNVTFIDSKVRLPQSEIDGFNAPNIQAPITSQPMTGAPEYLYNLFCTYDIIPTGTQFGIFYTVTGDTLIAGAGEDDGNFVPAIFATEVGTLNLTVAQNLGEFVKLQFQAKNLLNPEIETVYRSKYIGPDVLNTSYTKGIDLSVSLSVNIPF